MKEMPKVISLAGFGILVGIIFTLLFQDNLKCNKDVEPDLPDTVWVPQVYKPKPRPNPKNKLVPIVVIRYKEFPQPSVAVVDSGKYLLVIDSLGRLVDSLNKAFVTMFPKSPKLLHAFFSADSLSMTLQKPSGDVISEKYLTRYDISNYEFSHGEMYSVKKKPEKHKIQRKGYAYGGLEAFSSSTVLGYEERITWRSLEGALGTIGFIQQEPRFGVYMKVGVNIHGKNRR